MLNKNVFNLTSHKKKNRYFIISINAREIANVQNPVGTPYILYNIIYGYIYMTPLIRCNLTDLFNKRDTILSILICMAGRVNENY